MSRNPILQLTVGGVIAQAELYTDKAPQAVRALVAQLPFDDRTIQTRWSGNAFRTEANFDLVPRESGIENPIQRLVPGDLIYYRNYDLDLLKIGVAYGPAQWLGPYMYPRTVSHIGRVIDNRDALAVVCKRIIFEGPLDVRFSLLDEGDV